MEPSLKQKILCDYLAYEAVSSLYGTQKEPADKMIEIAEATGVPDEEVATLLLEIGYGGSNELLDFLTTGIIDVIGGVLEKRAQAKKGTEPLIPIEAMEEAVNDFLRRFYTVVYDSSKFVDVLAFLDAKSKEDVKRSFAEKMSKVAAVFIREKIIKLASEGVSLNKREVIGQIFKTYDEDVRVKLQELINKPNIIKDPKVKEVAQWLKGQIEDLSTEDTAKKVDMGKVAEAFKKLAASLETKKKPEKAEEPAPAEEEEESFDTMFDVKKEATVPEPDEHTKRMAGIPDC